MRTLIESRCLRAYPSQLVTAANGVLSFLLPPFSSILSYLAAAAVALVTLQVGALSGLQDNATDNRSRAGRFHI